MDMGTSKEKILKILQRSSIKAAERVNSIYGPATVTVNHTQFRFCRFHSDNFDTKDVPRCGWPIIENLAKIMEIGEFDSYASTVSIDCPGAKHCTKNSLKPFEKIWMHKKVQLAGTNGLQASIADWGGVCYRAKWHIIDINLRTLNMVNRAFNKNE